MSFKATQFHTEEQWILGAYDLEKAAYREFAVKDIHNYVNDIRVGKVNDVRIGTRNGPVQSN